MKTRWRLLYGFNVKNHVFITWKYNFLDFLVIYDYDRNYRQGRTTVNI